MNYRGYKSKLMAYDIIFTASVLALPKTERCYSPGAEPIHYFSLSPYKKATAIFYNDKEPGSITTLQAIALFCWWAPQSSIARRHSSWWWTSVLIRRAQQMNLLLSWLSVAASGGWPLRASA
ncbi:hypothetical protein B0H63DRAFT_528258 [Podospora didyma]|uniref:Uncharacterized protein n=1 Tax=Podospora didyma TaxID=330526 RepID=A0AAE0N4K2_9PEZI|nr:hypothetical protein B0H63DRAFT_528258 [Podospora didyma]